MATKKMTKNDKYFLCEVCDFNTCKKTNFNIHLQTQKHINNSLATPSNIKNDESSFICNKCNKLYNDRTGLWRHKKTCVNKLLDQELINKVSDQDTTSVIDKLNQCDNDLIMMLINDNKDLRNLLLEQCKENTEYKNMMMEQQTMMIKVLENGTHNTNSHNKSFNLNFFLNETCKDAMNIMEFVESIKLQLCDLEKVGELGYVEGISNIIVKNLKNLDVTQRPVHCTDKKRETMYIKDEDKWEKDDEQKKMHKIVRKVADKNARLLPKFKEAHPDCTKSTSIYSDQYNKIIIEALGGHGDNDFEKEEKIIKRVSKEVVVEKDM
jgi:hypothetical protein